MDAEHEPPPVKWLVWDGTELRGIAPQIVHDHYDWPERLGQLLADTSVCEHDLAVIVTMPPPDDTTGPLLAYVRATETSPACVIATRPEHLDALLALLLASRAGQPTFPGKPRG